MASAAQIDDDLNAGGDDGAEAAAAAAAGGDDEAAKAAEATKAAEAVKIAEAAAANGDWRSRMAGDDAELLKFLGRHGNEAAAIKEFKKLHAEIRSGKLLKPLGDDPTEAEVKAYREQMGVPEKPEAYLEKLSGGLVVGEADRPIVDKFLEKMHGVNAPASVVDAALQAYYGIVQDQDATIAETIAESKTKAEETLREEYGADYRRNMTAADSYLETLPAEVQTAINEGFDGKGIPLKNNPEVRKWMVALALEANPLATVVPGAGANQASAIADEIAALETRMRTDRTEYFKDKKAQDRYVELIEARDKMAEKTA